MTSSTHRQAPAGTYPLKVGTDLTLDGRSVRVHAFDTGESGLVEVVLDGGERLVRIPLMHVVAKLLEQRAPELDSSPIHPLLDELPPEAREKILRRYADLLEVKTGSPTGDPDAQRRAGGLDVRYDPHLTTQSSRLRTKSAELKLRGESGSSPATLKRQLSRIASGPEGLIHGSSGVGGSVLDGIDDHVLRVLRDVLAAERGGARISNRKLAVKARAALQREGLAEEFSTYRLNQILGELSRSDRFHLEAKARERHGLKPRRLYAERSVSRPGRCQAV